MHFEVLVEDASGGILLDHVLPRILSTSAGSNSCRIHCYKGIGHIPAGLRPHTDADKRILWDQLPRLLRGYGRSLRDQPAAVVVLVDQDTRCCMDLKAELHSVVNACSPRPTTLLRMAIEEMEAWLLGDRSAMLSRYPRARRQILDAYVQDSVCGTWEIMADAIYPGGSRRLKAEGYPRIGQVKCEWAEKIGPAMNVETNASRSFQVFRDGLRRLAGST
jgi:hypothetical protein